MVRVRFEEGIRGWCGAGLCLVRLSGVGSEAGACVLPASVRVGHGSGGSSGEGDENVDDGNDDGRGAQRRRTATAASTSTSTADPSGILEFVVALVSPLFLN